MFNRIKFVQNSVLCHCTSGYGIMNKICTKDLLYTVIYNSTFIPSFQNISIGVLWNRIVFHYYNDRTLKMDLGFFPIEIEDEIRNSNKIDLSMRLVATIEKVTYEISRTVLLIKDGLCFQISNLIQIHEIFGAEDVFFRFIVPFCILSLVIWREHGIKTTISTIASLIVAFMQAFFFGKFIPLFRICLTVSLLFEFFVSFNIDSGILFVFIPLVLLVISIGVTLHSILSFHSPWFSDLFQSIIVTFSLMVGDHVHDTVSSINGSPDYMYVIRNVLVALCIVVLAFAIVPSFERPFVRFLSNT